MKRFSLFNTNIGWIVKNNLLFIFKVGLLIATVGLGVVAILSLMIYPKTYFYIISSNFAIPAWVGMPIYIFIMVMAITLWIMFVWFVYCLIKYYIFKCRSSFEYDVF